MKTAFPGFKKRTVLEDDEKWTYSYANTIFSLHLQTCTCDRLNRYVPSGVRTDCTYIVGVLTLPHFGHFVPYSCMPFLAFSAKSCCFAMNSSENQMLKHPNNVAASFDRFLQRLAGIFEQLDIACLAHRPANADTDRY